MTAGLPGTGIGGLFYLLLAVCMPLREFCRTIEGKTSLRRWGFILLQILFVLTILSSMWGEVWLLNQGILGLRRDLGINCVLVNGTLAFQQTKALAFAYASASFISLAFIVLLVHVLRFFVHRARKPKMVSVHWLQNKPRIAVTGNLVSRATKELQHVR
jgi:hypothetical protein